LGEIHRKGKQAKRTAIIDIQNVIKIPGLMRYISLEKVKDFPNLKIYFQSDQLYLLRKRFIAGEVDLIMTGDKVIEHIPNIVIERIASFPLCISYSTAMFDCETVTISDFHSKDLLLYDPDGSNENYKYFLLEICNRLGIHPQIKYVQNGNILLALITNGLGFTIEPKIFNSLSEDDSACFLPTDTQIWLCLGRLKENNDPEIVKLQNEIVRYCKHVLNELPN